MLLWSSVATWRKSTSILDPIPAVAGDATGEPLHFDQALDG
jgi:hypothetical protein